MNTPIVMSLRDYLDARDVHACVACGAVAEPIPRKLNDSEGRERRCVACSQESALPLDVAAREGWLRVLDDAGRVLNDTCQSTEVR